MYIASGNTTIKKMAESAVALSLVGNSSVESIADDAMATNHEKGIIYKSKEGLKVVEI